MKQKHTHPQSTVDEATDYHFLLFNSSIKL